MLSIWLVIVAAVPVKRKDAGSRETYGVLQVQPPFPPDIGPLYLPKGYLDDYPLSQNQKQWISQKNLNEHRCHVRSPSFLSQTALRFIRTMIMEECFWFMLRKSSRIRRWPR